MVDLSNYYQREPLKNESPTSERYPRNHVKFSGLLKPLQWIDSAYVYNFFKMMTERL